MDDHNDLEEMLGMDKSRMIALTCNLQHGTNMFSFKVKEFRKTLVHEL